MEDEDDEADGTPEGDEEGKEARKRQVRCSPAAVSRWPQQQQPPLWRQEALMARLSKVAIIG